MIDTGDTAWVLTSTALVLFMTLPGLGLFYAGLVQSKNILSVLMHCIAIACLASVLWFVVAYSIAFTQGTGLAGGLSKALLIGVARDSVAANIRIPETVFVMFQMTFAIITPALIVGAFVERIKFSAVLMFTGIWLLVVYAPVAHWVWGGGFLATAGALGHFFAAVSDMIARPMRSHLGTGPGKEAVIGYWPNAAIGLVRNAGEQWLASPASAHRPDQAVMARQITDWLCFGIAGELEEPPGSGAGRP